ncbi:unannotated protein [freshwater metagenome]|uniref:Unannotated protein n=1 Tax=freshwater metagenome TaxID=449393 RepID=A0A6J7IJC5_9ZZZZ|nr:rRNA maturation RNase YbeY [Actinomycetota bacterium]
MLEVEIIGTPGVAGAPLAAEVERLLAFAFATAGIDAGHVALEYVDAQRIAELNEEYRGKEGPTDVLSFPLDETGVLGEPPEARELGDIIICVAHTADLREAIVHGGLHLVGMDHETDEGEMLAVQAEILSWG